MTSFKINILDYFLIFVFYPINSMKSDQGDTSTATVLLRKLRELSVMEGVCLSLVLYLLIIRLLSVFSYNTDMEGVEFASVHFLQLLKLKHHLYTDPGKFPYLLVVYAPLYYYVMLAVINLFSIDVVNDLHSMYIAGRAVSLACCSSISILF